MNITITTADDCKLSAVIAEEFEGSPAEVHWALDKMLVELKRLRKARTEDPECYPHLRS